MARACLHQTDSFITTEIRQKQERQKRYHNNQDGKMVCVFGPVIWYRGLNIKANA